MKPGNDFGRAGLRISLATCAASAASPEHPHLGVLQFDLVMSGIDLYGSSATAELETPTGATATAMSRIIWHLLFEVVKPAQYTRATNRWGLP
jgi:hypothetical protein